MRTLHLHALACVGSASCLGMSDNGERIPSDPFAVTLDQKASATGNVLLAGALIDTLQRIPRHMRQIMMHEMVVVVQKQILILRILSGWASKGD
jgi:hypothetical protein